MAIVIVDDNVQVRESTRQLFEGAGIEVLGEASNGAEALALIEFLKPALVVMDGQMPVMDGATAIRHLRELHPDLAVIAHTADQHYADKMSAAGATGVVLKGTGPAQLLEVVRATLPQKREAHLKPVGKTTTGAARLRAALFRYAEFHPESFPPESVPAHDNEGWWLTDGSLAIRLTAIPRIALEEGLGHWMEHLLELRERGEIVADPNEDGVARTINGARAVVFGPVTSSRS